VQNEGHYLLANGLGSLGGGCSGPAQNSKRPHLEPSLFYSCLDSSFLRVFRE